MRPEICPFDNEPCGGDCPANWPCLSSQPGPLDVGVTESRALVDSTLELVSAPPCAQQLDEDDGYPD